MSVEAERVMEKEQNEVIVENEAEKKVEGMFLWKRFYI